MIPAGPSSRTGGVGDPTSTDILRRLSNLLRFGKVHSADYPAARIRVVIGDATDPTGHVVTAWIPWLTTRAGKDREWWAPEVGEPVLVLAPGGELGNSVALPSTFSDSGLAPADRETVHRVIYEDGAVIEYDRAAHKLTATIPGDVAVDATGEITATAGGDVSVTSAGGTSITSTGAVTISAPSVAISGEGGGASIATLKGNFTLEGNLDVQGNISATGSIMDGGGNSNNHTH